jgi:hypothetical protein
MEEAIRTRKKVLGRISIGGIAGFGLPLAAACAHRSVSQEPDWTVVQAELVSLAEPARERRAARSPEEAELAASLAHQITAIAGRLQELHPGFADGEPGSLPSTMPDDETLAATRGVLARLWEPLAEWESLARGPGLRRALATGSVVSRPRLLVLRSWTNLLCWQSMLDALDGRADPAGALASALYLAQAFDDGTTIGWMIRGAGERLVMDACRALLEQGALDARVLEERLRSPLARIASRPPHELLENDALAFLDCLPQGSGVEAFAKVYYQLDMSLYLEEQRERSLDALEREMELLATRTAIVRIALAVEAHRAEHGALPASLDELAWAFPDGIPVDPIAQRVFPYVVDGDRARLGPGAWCEREPVAWDIACERLRAWEFRP